ncbi:hypothetical protein Bbelb_111330 [Branchiostoma belcheri]|nr:hypothetical protein Bbelb_111330 [Branchiostoma belcheri]
MARRPQPCPRETSSEENKGDDVFTAKSERGGPNDLPVESTVVENVFLEVCEYRYGQIVRRLVERDCLGCEISHPSQKRHACLYLDNDDMNEYRRRSLDSLDFRKLYGDYYGITGHLCDVDEVPSPKFMLRKYEKWYNETLERTMEEDAETDGEEEDARGCKNGPVYPWIKDLIERQFSAQGIVL